MKYCLFAVIMILTATNLLKAQTLKELTVEPAEGLGIYNSSCSSPSLGMLVFKSAIAGLNFELNMADYLKNVEYKPQSNEYVLCVQASSRPLFVYITGEGCERVNFQVKKIEASIPQFFKINPKQTGTNTTADESYKLGNFSFSEKNYAEAETYYRRAVEAVPDNAEYHRSVGAALLAQNNYSDATVSLLKAAGLRPTNADIQYLLGNAYYGQGKYDDAAKYYKMANDLTPSNAQYRIALQKALNANPNGAKINTEMGNDYLAQGKYAEALKYYREAAKLDPQNKALQANVNRADVLIKQEQHMTAAAKAFKSGKSLVGMSFSGNSQQIANQRANALKPYQQAIDETNKAKALGTLPPYMQESTDFYTFEYEYQKNQGNVSSEWLKEFLRQHPETPLRTMIEERIVSASRIFRGEIGFNVAYNELFAVSGLAGIKLWSCEKLVNLHVGVQYTYYISNYYNTSDDSKKPDNDNTWQISANQISLPVTLQLNVLRPNRKSVRPQSLFIAATAVPNYNFNGTCFSETSKDFVEPFGYSGIVSLGYGGNSFSFSVFCRKNFTELFKRDKIFEFDNQNSKNDYSLLDKKLENRLLFGASIGFCF